MSTTYGIIDSPVHLKSDIANLLNVPNASLGYLCSNKHGNTRRFAKYKPTIWHGGVPRSSTPPYQCIKYQGYEYWQADDGFCGFRIPMVNGVALTSDNLIGSDWEYIAPQGGAAQPYCLGYWIGYNHEAVAPYSVIYPTNALIGQETFIGFIDQAGINQLTLPEILRNLNSGGGVFVGVMVEDDKNNMRFFTSDNILSAGFGGNFNVRVKFTTNKNKCTLFITDREASGGILPSAARCYPFYSEVIRQVNVTATTSPVYTDKFVATSITVTNVDYNFVDFTAVVQNVGTSAAALEHRYIYLSYNITDEYGGLFIKDRIREWRTDMVGHSLGAGESATVSLRFYLADINTKRSWKGMFALDYSADGQKFDALGGKQIEYEFGDTTLT